MLSRIMEWKNLRSGGLMNITEANLLSALDPSKPLLDAESVTVKQDSKLLKPVNQKVLSEGNDNLSGSNLTHSLTN